jgi:hypothetical protein
MQDRTINNALVAVYRAGGDQAKIAAQLMALRGVPIPPRIYDRPLSRGKCRSLVLAALKDGPKTTGQIGKIVQTHVTGITQTAAANRAYQALLRLEEMGRVEQDRRLWGLCPKAHFNAALVTCTQNLHHAVSVFLLVIFCQRANFWCLLAVPTAEHFAAPAQNYPLVKNESRRYGQSHFVQIG